MHHSIHLSKYQLSALSLNIQQYKLHYTPQHVSSSTLLIVRRTNCITTASGIVTLCKQPYSMLVESGPPAYCTAVCEEWRYQRLWWYNWSSWWWAACCSKHVEECNVTYCWILRECALSWYFERSHGAEFFEKLIVPQLVVYFLHFTEPEIPSPCSQKPTTCPYTAPDATSPRLHRIFLRIHF